MILAVNLGVCPDYCYCNLRHLFAYNNILWEYHSPRETWHPQTQNVSNDILLDDFRSYLESFPCSELSSEPHGPIIMSGKLKSASGTQTIAGIKYERRVKDKSDQYCKYCRHKSYLSNIFMKTCGPTVPTPHPAGGCQPQQSPLKLFTVEYEENWVEILYKSN